jgi:hypothetical protein
MSPRSAHRGPRLGTRVAVLCSVADQGVAAFTSVAVLLLAARLCDAGDFAVFSLVHMVATVLLGLFGAYVGQALVLRRGAPARDACKAAMAFTAGAGCVLGFTGTAVLALLRLPGEAPRGLGALGLVLPAILSQDALRYCFSALRHPQLALCADALRLLVTVPVLAAQPEGSGPGGLVLVWGACALPALALGGMLLAPLLRGAYGDPRQLVRRGHLGRRFAVEFAVGNGASQLAIVGLGLFADPLTVGALRGASALYGPLNVLCNSATSFGPPLLRRAFPDQRRNAEQRGSDPEGTRRTVRTTAALAALLALTAAGWTLLLTALPGGAGQRLLGATWESARSVLPATGGQYVGIALATSALLTLRVLRPRSTLPLQVVFSLASVGFLSAGYAWGGTLGAAWGLCLGSALKAVALWGRTASLRRRELSRGTHSEKGSRTGSRTDSEKDSQTDSEKESQKDTETEAEGGAQPDGEADGASRGEHEEKSAHDLSTGQGTPPAAGLQRPRL